MQEAVLFEALILFSKVLLGVVRECHCTLRQSSFESCCVFLVSVCVLKSKHVCSLPVCPLLLFAHLARAIDFR